MSMFARRKSTSTAQRLSLGIGRVEGHELDVLYGLEAAGMAFGVGDLVDQTVEVRRQGHRLQNGFPVLDAFDVALVGVFI
jgi:hypothetical protein